MMQNKKKIAQPFRNPNEYSCYLEGVKAAAKALGYKVDSLAWGGGIPTDLTLYTWADKPEPVVVHIEDAAGLGDDGETDAGTE
jgi:hypothetical protein